MGAAHWELATGWYISNITNCLSSCSIFSLRLYGTCVAQKYLVLTWAQPSQLLMAKGNCLRYCQRRENHWQQIFAVDHLFTIRYEPFSILLNKIFSFIQMFTLLKKHSSPDYFTLSISFPFILDFNALR